jgi:hypothetical protein
MKLDTILEGETGGGYKSDERLAELITVMQGWPVTEGEVRAARETGAFIRVTNALNYTGEIWMHGVPVLRAAKL